MENKVIEMNLINAEEVENIFKKNLNLPLELIERSFLEKANGNILLPDKISQVFDQTTQERINCLPATLLSQRVSGVKWISVFPTNAKKDLINVTGVILLSSIDTGYPLAMIDGTFATALRTSAIGAVAAKYLSKADSNTIGFIGSGEQARMHFRMISLVRNLKTCYVSSRNISGEESFVKSLRKDFPETEFIMCNGDYGRAVQDADIIVTAVSCQQPLLKARYVKKGALYIHVGGWEDEYAVAQNADKIICDDWESVKHRSQTLSRLYFEGLLKDEDIYGNLDQIISGEKLSRENDEEIIYFNSVGLAFIDVMFAYEIYEQSKKRKFGSSYLIHGSLSHLETKNN